MHSFKILEILNLGYWLFKGWIWNIVIFYRHKLNFSSGLVRNYRRMEGAGKFQISVEYKIHCLFIVSGLFDV